MIENAADAASDSINDLLHFPRFYHPKIVDAVKSYGFQELSDIAQICNEVSRFRKATESHRQSQASSDISLAEIEDWLDRLVNQARSFQMDPNPFIRSTAFALELILDIFWSSQQIKIDSSRVATGMKNALCRLHVRPCSYMDLTSGHFMIGAIAAVRGSSTRLWFVSKLQRAVKVLKARGWANPLDIVEQGFVPDLEISCQLQDLWKEVSLGCS
jgi:hypothetical protein